MKKRLSSVISIVLAVFLLVSSVAYAAYEFYFPVTATDTSGSTRTNYPLMLGIGGQSFVDSGKIGSDGLDTNMQVGATDIEYMMSTTNITAVVPTLAGGGATTLSLYTGFSPAQTLFPIITGAGGYVTVDDAANLELSDNFTINQTLYLDTDNGTDKNIWYKEDALEVFVSPTVSGNITARRVEELGLTENLRPDSAGDATALLVSGAATNWQAVSDDSDTSFVYMEGAGWVTDYYNLGASSIPSYAVVDNISVTIRVKEVPSQAGTQEAKAILRLSAVDTTSSAFALTDAWVNQTATLARPGGGDWNVSDLADLQAGVSLYDNSHTAGDKMECSEVTVIVNYHIVGKDISLTGLSSGEYPLAVDRNHIFYSLDVSGDGYELAPSSNLVLNTPLWQTECNSSPFTSIDDYIESCTVSGATWTSDGYDIDTGEYIKHTEANWCSANLSGTLSVWFETDTNVGYKTLFSSCDEAATNNYWTFRIQATNGKLYLETKDGAGDRGYVQGTTAVHDGNWHHVVLTSDGSTWTIYLDTTPESLTSGYDGNIGDWFGDVTGRDNFAIGAQIMTSVVNTMRSGTIGEVQVWAEHFSQTDVTNLYNSQKWKYDGTTTRRMESTLGAVPDNSNDIYMWQTNVSPYADNSTLDIGGVEQLYFAPNAIILGTNLPDRGSDATANDGTITWGSNSDVTLHYGAMVSSESTDATYSAPGGFNMPSTAMPTHWYNDTADLSGLPLYEAINGYAGEAGMPVAMVYFWLAIGLAWAVMIGVTATMKSAFLGAICMVLVLVVGMSQGIVAGWIVFAVVVVDGFIIFLYRQVAY